MIKKWISFINESIKDNNIIDIVKTYDYDRLYIIDDVSKIDVKEFKNNKLIKADNIFNQANIIKNFLNYYSDINYTKSEIVKMEFDNYNWIIISACYTDDTKFAYITSSPDMLNTKMVSSLYNDITNNGYFITKSKDIKHNFIHDLVYVFRNISGRYYNSDMLSSIKDNFVNFKNKYKSEWTIYSKWKNNILGGTVKCVRFIDISQTFSVNLVDGGTKMIKDLVITDLFYYPISNRAFSQWAMVDSKISDIKKDLININSSTNLGFLSNIPSDNIIMSNNIIPHNFSPHVNEREVIVEHDVSQKFDINIICQII